MGGDYQSFVDSLNRQPKNAALPIVEVNGVEYVPGDWKKCHRCGDAVADVATLEEALRAIRGPADSGPWIAAYQDAGGGYEGLQAIAETALAAVERGR
jgi:thiamine monophosphate kinase